MLDLLTMHGMAQRHNKFRSSNCHGFFDFSAGQLVFHNRNNLVKISDEDFLYQPPQGLTSLRAAYSYDVLGLRSGKFLNNIYVTVGGKQAIFIAMSFLIRPNSCVILPFPCWEPYLAMATSLGAKIVTYAPNNIGALLQLINQNANSIVLINYPHNPTGAQVTIAELSNICSMARKSACAIISDEVYRRIDASNPTAATFFADGFNITVVDSISKWAGAAGLRVGFLMGSDDLLSFAHSVVSVSSSGTSSLSQKWASVEYHNDLRLVEVREFVANSLVSMSSLFVQNGYKIISKGGIYLWVEGDMDFAINDVVVRGLSGKAFGDPGKTRLCPVSNPEGLRRILEHSQSDY